MLGEEYINKVDDFDSAMVIHNRFHLIAPIDNKEDTIINANNIIFLNNEVYRRLNDQYFIESKAVYLKQLSQGNQLMAAQHQAALNYDTQIQGRKFIK